MLHIITGLGQGGAEATLYRLLSAVQDRADHAVLSLGGEGFFGSVLQELGVKVYALNLRRGVSACAAPLRLYMRIRELRPRLVQTWMYHANLVGGVAARLAGTPSVVWGIRNSLAALDEMSLSARMAARIGARLSGAIPNMIICNSIRAADRHTEIGYRADKFVVIPNGYDLSQLVPDYLARQRLRAEWGVTSTQVLLGLVGRWDKQKDHSNLLGALRILVKKRPNLKCVLVGTQMNTSNRELITLIEHYGVGASLILAGPRGDVPAVMNALDLHVLSSAGEAFPNTVAEAMACGTPCVVTDVGDAALIVGDTGWVVPPRNPFALAEAVERALWMISTAGRDKLAAPCRHRIAENFTLERAVAAYEAVWERVATETS